MEIFLGKMYLNLDGFLGEPIIEIITSDNYEQAVSGFATYAEEYVKKWNDDDPKAKVTVRKCFVLKALQL